MATKHAVVRIDNMAGITNSAFIRSVKYHNGSNYAEIDNAQIVVCDSKIDREVYKATAPTTSTKVGDLYLIAGVELFYDQTKAHYLTEWVNAADVAVRAYKVHEGDTFSATAEAFDGTPDVGKYVGFAESSTKLKVQDSTADDKTFGKIVLKETIGYGDGAYTYYMIDVIPTGARS